jgi:hypothetical protein
VQDAMLERFQGDSVHHPKAYIRRIVRRRLWHLDDNDKRELHARQAYADELRQTADTSKGPETGAIVFVAHAEPGPILEFVRMAGLPAAQRPRRYRRPSVRRPYIR